MTLLFISTIKAFLGILLIFSFHLFLHVHGFTDFSIFFSFFPFVFFIFVCSTISVFENLSPQFSIYSFSFVLCTFCIFTCFHISHLSFFFCFLLFFWPLSGYLHPAVSQNRSFFLHNNSLSNLKPVFDPFCFPVVGLAFLIFLCFSWFRLCAFLKSFQFRATCVLHVSFHVMFFFSFHFHFCFCFVYVFPFSQQEQPRAARSTESHCCLYPAEERPVFSGECYLVGQLQ